MIVDIKKMKEKWLWDPRIKYQIEDEDIICTTVFNFNGNIDEIIKIVKLYGINVKTTIHDLSLLHLACKYEKLELVKYLMKNEANNSIRDITGKTPLFYCVHHKNTEIVEILKLNKITIKYKDIFNLEAIYYANIFNENIFMYLNIKQLNEIAATNELYLKTSRELFENFLTKINNENIDDYELYLFACETNNYKFISDVINDFIDVKSIDVNGLTFLHKIFLNYLPSDRDFYSVSSDLKECINKGANVNEITTVGKSLSRIVIERQMSIEILNMINGWSGYSWPIDQSQQTDLQYTIINKQDEYFNWFIENTTQFSCTDKNENNCLHLAVMYTPDILYDDADQWKSCYIIKLLETCEHRLLYERNYDNKSALDMAKELKKTNMVKLLEELMDEDAVMFINKKSTDILIEKIFEYYFLIRLNWIKQDDIIEEIEKFISIDNESKLLELLKTEKNYGDEYGRIALHHVNQFKDLEIIKKVFRLNLRKSLKRDTFGKTPFHYAGIYNIELYSYFNNEMKNICDKGTLYILEKETVQFIKEKDSFHRFINYCYKEKITKFIHPQFMTAVCRFNDKILTKLYAQIGNYYDKERYLQTPLQMAVDNFNWKFTENWLILVKNLLIFDKTILLKKDENEMLSLLHAGAGHGSKKFYQFLLGYGHNVNDVDCFGKTVIHYILEKQTEYDVLDFLYNNSNIEAIDNNGDNYLHYTVKYIIDGWEYSDKGLSMVFVEKLMRKNNIGKTPLHIAGELGKIETFDLLLTICTNDFILTLDNNNKTALDYVAENEHYEIIWNDILRRHKKTDSNFIQLYFTERENNQQYRDCILVSDQIHEFLKSDQLLKEGGGGSDDILKKNNFLKLFEKFSIFGISLEPEIEFNIQNSILDSDLIVVNRNNLNKPSVDNTEYVKGIKTKVLFLVNLINDTISKLSSSNNIDYEILEKIKEIVIIIRQLKDNKYIDVPWFKIEFILVAFLTIYSQQNKIDTFLYKVILNKKRIQMHLEKFVGIFLKKLINGFIEKLEQPQGKPMKQNITQNDEFKELNDDFEATRTFYSLTKILRYVNKSIEVKINQNRKTSILVIMRTIQVFGEYIKKSDMSPNVTDKIINTLSIKRYNLKNCLIKIRNDLSHADYMKSILDMESNTELYTSIQNDLKDLRSSIIHLLYDEREDCIQNLLTKMFNSKTKDNLNSLCTNFIHTKDSNIEIPECDPFHKVQNLIQMLKDIYVYIPNDKENIFLKIDNIILKQNKNSEQMISNNFGKPDTFLLNSSEEKRNIDKKKEFLRMNETGKKTNEPLQLISYYILQIQKMTETESFLIRKEVYDEIQSICNEILVTSIIGVKEKILPHLIYDSSTVELTILDKPNQTQNNNQNEKLNEISNNKQLNVKLKKQQQQQQRKLNVVQKTEEEEKLIENIKELNLEQLNTKEELEKFTIILFDNNFSLFNKSEGWKNDDEEDEDKKKNFELKNCFIDRIEKLKELLPDKEKYLEHLKKPNELIIMAVEMIILNLYEMLKELKMVKTNGDILESFVPLISTTSLRNYLAHGDALYDLLPFNTEISIFSNAYHLINLINKNQFNIFSDEKIIYYSRESNLGISSIDKYQNKMILNQLKNEILNKSVNCNLYGSLCYFYKIPVFRRVDPQGRTLFNLIFENDPKVTINFFMNPKNRIIRSPQSIDCLNKLLIVTYAHLNQMDIVSLCQYFINQLFVVSERHEVITLLIKICSIYGYHEEIDKIFVNENVDFNNTKKYETFLKSNYKTLMDFADQYSFVKNVQRYSRTIIPGYSNDFSLLELATTFEHTEVIKRLVL